MRKTITILLLAMTIGACGASATTVEPQPIYSTGFEIPAPTAIEDPPAITNNLRSVMTKWDLWSSEETLLRGANISQAILIPELDGPTFKGPGPIGPPYTQEDFYRLSDLGANYVSISGPGIFSIYPPYEVLPDVVAHYDTLLEMIANADMFVTIGFRTGPGRSDWSICCADESWAQPYLVDTVWQDRDQQAAWVEMWRAAAEHFRDNPKVVAYKLMVEPNAAARHFNFYDPETFFSSHAGSTYDWNSWFPNIIDAIREVDTQTPILVSADDFSSLDWLANVEIVEDEKTAYYIDQYDPFPYTHQISQGLSYPGKFDTDFDGDQEDFNIAWLQGHMDQVDGFRNETHRKVTIEEFGLVRWAQGGADYLSDLMDIFEDKGLNYAVWLWETEWTEYTDSVNEFNWRFGPDQGNTQDVPNELQDALTSFWSLNRLRPSNVDWLE